MGAARPHKCFHVTLGTSGALAAACVCGRVQGSLAEPSRVQDDHEWIMRYLITQYTVSVRYPVLYFCGEYHGVKRNANHQLPPEPLLILEEDTYQYQVEGKRVRADQKCATGKWMAPLP